MLFSLPLFPLSDPPFFFFFFVVVVLLARSCFPELVKKKEKREVCKYTRAACLSTCVYSFLPFFFFFALR